MLIESVLFALQYGDSGYPAGGYAHSHGLETAVERGTVCDAATLDRYLRSWLVHQAGPTDAVAAAACARAAAGQDTEAFITCDRRLTATKPAREVREGSHHMGLRLLVSAVASEGGTWPRSLRAEVAAERADGNYACVLGALAGVAMLRSPEAAAITLWSMSCGLVNAALRLSVVTHDEGQVLLTRLRPLLDQLAGEAARADPQELAGSAPVTELYCMQHETDSVRLFAS